MNNIAYGLAGLVVGSIASAVTSYFFADIYFDIGKQAGKDETVIYCNVSPDYCKLQLDRMAERDVKPPLYLQLIAKPN